MTPDRIAEAHAVTVALESRIAALLEQRAWDRRWMRATWTPARHDRETELRALLAVRRTGKRLAREAVERASSDRLYRELGYHAAQAVPV
jgi:hypothetical protein